MKFFEHRHRLTPLSLLPLLFFLFVVGEFEVAGQTAKTTEENQIEMNLKPDKETIMLGEPSFISFEVKNLSDQNLCLGIGGDYRNNLGRPESFKVSVVRHDGRAVPQPEANGFGGFSGCANISVNGSYVFKLFLPHWATFAEVGDYTVNVKRRMAFFNHKAKTSVFPDSDFVLQADVSANIHVVPSDEHKMGELIRSLGDAMLDINNPEANDSAQALAYINDRRTVKYFARAIEKFGRFAFFDGGDEYQISSRAISALSKFNDDSAIAALEAAMGSPSEDTRLSVATALAYSEHPKVMALLLNMQHDGYRFVRLRVAQSLGKMKTAESLAALYEMLNDEDEDVRKAAQDGLKTGGPK